MGVDDGVHVRPPPKYLRVQRDLVGRGRVALELVAVVVERHDVIRVNRRLWHASHHQQETFAVRQPHGYVTVDLAQLAPPKARAEKEISPQVLDLVAQLVLPSSGPGRGRPRSARIRAPAACSAQPS